MEDWVECGGSPWGSYTLAPLPNGKERTTLEYNADAGVKVDSIYRCMMKKNYEYTGQCTSSVMSDSPPCRARAGLTLGVILGSFLIVSLSSESE